MSQPNHLDPTLTPATRAAALLEQMTLAEKVGQMLQLDARSGVEHSVTTLLAGSLLHASPQTIERVAELVSSTRLRIPILMADDAIHGHSFWPGATILPTQLAMACSWDPDLIERAGRMTAVEVAATGLHWTFSPVLCIARDTRWGRVGETFGEDPFLIGELGAAMVRGYQGEGVGDSTAVLACMKHFAGYSETQGGRDASEADLTPRKLRSWLLPPFERAVRAGVRTAMIGYQSIDGVPVTANRWLLNDVLKREWGFTGVLVTDWDNVGRMVWEQKVCADDLEAAVTAVRAGIDLVMTTPAFFEAAQEAVRSGILAEADIDEAVRRILTLKFELGLFERAHPTDAVRAAVIGTPAHRELNLEVARRSIVLLRNDGTLPLPAQAPAPRRVLVVGPNADDPHAQLGDWAGASGQVDWMPEGHPRDLITTVLDGMRALAPHGWQIEHRRGARIGDTAPDPRGEVAPDGQPRPPVFVPAAPDPAEIADAVAAATAADYVVAVLGDDVSLTGEGRSTATLELQGGQVALLDALVDTGTPVILVLVQSKPSTLPPSAERAAAIVQAFNPGMTGGHAVAELLYGLIEPSGRLPLSVPRHAGQLPVYYNQVRGQHGDRYADLTQEPLFVFGEGLGYARAEYRDLRMLTPRVDPKSDVRAQVLVKNVGERDLLETVQVYVRDEITSVTWADRELKSFQQVYLAPGAESVVEIAVPAAQCSVVDAAGRRVVEPGAFTLLVGHSSREADLLAVAFEIVDASPAPA